MHTCMFKILHMYTVISVSLFIRTALMWNSLFSDVFFRNTKLLNEHLKGLIYANFCVAGL